MKVVLSTSPHVRHPAVLQADFRLDPSVMYTFAPVGLLSLMAVCEQQMAGIETSLYDVNRRIISGELPLDERLYRRIAEELTAGKPDVVGMMTECDSYHHVLQIAEQVKRTAPDCKLVLGGPHASAVADATLHQFDCVDAVVIGEGELSFPELIEAYRSGRTEPVPGTLRRIGDRSILRGETRALVDDLDSLPIPAYANYHPDAGEEVFIEVGRGCPFQCAFCSTAPYWRRKHRVKSPARIVAEVQAVQRLYGAARAHFTHDLFTTRRQWVESVCAALVAAGAPIRWTCSARTDTVDRELLERMHDAGCDAIYFGIESGSPRILSEIRKDILPSRSLAVVSMCREVGITPNSGVIIGFPTESVDSARDTLAMYEELLRRGSRPAHVFGYCPFADSSMYAELGDLEFRGHFIDLPLSPKAAARNRAMIASQPMLFGSYYRPHLDHIVPDDPGSIDGVDEFSTLVEAAVYPALACAKLMGGMYELYARWSHWIADVNRARGADESRLRYGSPVAFASFLFESLVGLKASAAVLEASRATVENLQAIDCVRNRQPTSMATYRSVPRPSAAGVARQPLLGNVVARMKCRFDVVPALQGCVEADLDEKRLHLVWHIDDRGNLRLLDVNATVFAAIDQAMRPSTPAHRREFITTFN